MTYAFKGIDDLLAAGRKPRRLTGPEAAAFFAAPSRPPTVIDDGPAPAAELTRPPFPVEVFPEPVAGFVRRVAAATGCPVDFVAVGALVVAGAAVGAARSLRVKDGWYEKPAMYAVVVSRPGTAKTPALRAVMKPVYEAQEAEYRRHREALDEYKQAAERYKAATRAGNDEEADPPAEPPPLRHLFASDTTCEALAANLADNPKGLVLFRDELTAWVKAMDQYKGSGTDRQFFLSAWSGEMVKVDRKGQLGRPVIIAHPFLSVLGGIQPDLLPVLQAEGGREDGFVDRLLFAYPPEAPPRGWIDDEISPDDEEAWRRVLTRLQLAGLVTPEGGSPHPKVLSFSPAGREAYARWTDAQAAEMSNPDFPAELLGPYSKLRAYCARFALVVHLLRAACGEAGDERDEGPVDEADVGRAARLCSYFAAHARAVLDRLGRSEQDLRVEKALDWVRRKKRDRVTVRELTRAGIPGIRTAPDAQGVLAAIAERGLGDFQNRTSKQPPPPFVFVVDRAGARQPDNPTHGAAAPQVIDPEPFASDRGVGSRHPTAHEQPDTSGNRVG